MVQRKFINTYLKMISLFGELDQIGLRGCDIFVNEVLTALNHF